MAEYIDLVKSCADAIWASLGPGYSERVYHNAFEVLLRSRGLSYETERIIPIEFMGHVVGNLRADIVVNRALVVELKAVRSIKEENRVQARKYLELTGMSHALLVNFPQPGGDCVEFFLVEV